MNADQPKAGETWGPYVANSGGWYTLQAQPDYTPGPLLVQRDDGYIENWRIVKMLPDGPTQVAGTFTEADAKLYAAAPELLAALEMMLKALKETMPCVARGVVQDYAILNDAPLAAKRAISKAKGQS